MKEFTRRGEADQGVDLHHLKIRQWLEHLKTIEAVKMVVLEGSLVYGPTSPASDIDLQLFLGDADFAELWEGDRSRLFEGMGHYRVLYHKNYSRLLTEDGLIWEIEAAPISKAADHASFGYEILYHRLEEPPPRFRLWTGSLNESHPPRRPTSPEYVRGLFHNALYTLASAPSPFFHGQPESCLLFLDGVRSQLMTLLYRRAGISFGKRIKHLSDVFPEEWLHDLHVTWPKGPDVLELHVIASALLESFKRLEHHLAALSEQAGGGFDPIFFRNIYQRTETLLQPFLVDEEPSQVQLVEKVGIKSMDRVLENVCGVLHLLFPNRVKSVFLHGSYAYKAATDTSDLDLLVIFENRMTVSEQKRFKQIQRYFIRMISVGIDIYALNEEALYRTGFPVLSRDSLLLFGDDIRTRLPEQPVDYRHWVMHTGYGPSGKASRVRWGKRFIVFPVESVAPDEPFHGYDRRRVVLPDGSLSWSTKMLWAVAFQLGDSLIGWKTGECITNKTTFIDRYREVIGDSWGDVLEEVYSWTAMELQGLIPEDPESRKRLSACCERVIEFENYFLEIYRDFLLQELETQPADPAPLLTSEELAERLLMTESELTACGSWSETPQPVPDLRLLTAVAMLGRVIYDDDRIRKALAESDTGNNPLLVFLVERTKRHMQEAL